MSRSVTMDPPATSQWVMIRNSAISVALWIAGGAHGRFDAHSRLMGGACTSRAWVRSISRDGARGAADSVRRGSTKFDRRSAKLWRITREAYSVMPDVGRAVLDGDELRELVKRALALRAAQRSAEPRP